MTQSARGLFAALGHTSTKPKAERDSDDFVPTPAEPLQALLHVERKRLTRYRKIWEPACGDGRMCRQLEEAGFEAIGSDLVDRGCGAIIRSFYDFETAPAQAIITNPPFQECNGRDSKGRWIRHAIEAMKADYMALLLPWSWPSANVLGPLWSKYPPAYAYLMRWRIDFTGDGAPPMNCGWFVWDSTWQGETALRMLDRVDVRQPSLLDMED